MEESDAELVLRVRGGDGHAADRLLERYIRACRAVALAVTGSEADADDVCQDAFVSAVERIDDCRDPAVLEGGCSRSSGIVPAISCGTMT
ncbi:MAG: RNA polymerase sigma factor [Gemmatimonadales bacterium]